MQTTIDARDADPVAPTAAPIYLERRRLLVMTANIPGGDDRKRQNLGVGDTRPPITAPPQAFHQGVHHDHIRDVGGRQLAIKVIMYSKTIRPRLARAKPACASRELQQ